MRRERRRIAGAVSFATIVLLVLLAFRPVSTERLLAGYVLALAAIVLAALTRLARGGRRGDPTPFEQALAQGRGRDGGAPELARIERELVLGQGSAGYAQRQLLPLLRECAAGRLSLRHGVDLERQQARAAALLGEETWELLRPDRPPPADRNAPGLPAAAIERAVARLEAL